MENAFTRWMKFNAVGASGLVVHLGLLSLFVRVFDLHYLIASAVAIEAAILHKFFWHCRWTWADRFSDRAGFAARARIFLRFNTSSGLVATFGNLVSVYLLTGFWELDPILANVISIGPGGLANFLLCNWLVFTPHFAPQARVLEMKHDKKILAPHFQKSHLEKPALFRASGIHARLQSSLQLLPHSRRKSARVRH